MINKSVNQQELAAIGIETPKENIVLYYDKRGVPCDSDQAVAKSIEILSEDGKSSSFTYHVKHGRGQVFDPYGIDMNKTNAYNFQFKKVDEEIFKNYIKYLLTRREIYLISARRAFINKGY